MRFLPRARRLVGDVISRRCILTLHPKDGPTNVAAFGPVDLPGQGEMRFISARSRTFAGDACGRREAKPTKMNPLAQSYSRAVDLACSARLFHGANTVYTGVAVAFSFSTAISLRRESQATAD